MKYRRQNISRDRWAETASPFLLRKSKHRNTQPFHLSKKGNPLTRRQLKNKRKAEFKRLRKLKMLNKRENKKRKPKRKQKYAVYIISNEWRERCKQFYKKYGKKCAACDSIKRIHMHHMSYRHLGNELDEELAPLCKDCHDEYHALNGVQANMIQKTTAFIEEKRQMLIATPQRIQLG